MNEWVDIINSQKTFCPKSFLEIGSMDGEDAFFIKNKYEDIDVYVIEPHPEFYKNIKNKYENFKVFNFASFNYNGIISFNAVKPDKIVNQGISSIMNRNEEYSKDSDHFYEVNISCKRMETFMEENNIREIDIVKIDVEGNSYEVLEGFGDKLKNIKCIHIENEHVEVWKNQKLYSDVERILINNGFILLYIKNYWPQSDSVWIRKEFYNPRWYI